MSKPKSDVVMDLPQDAQREAIRLVSRLRAGDNVGSVIRQYEEFFTGNAYEAYMNELWNQLQLLAEEKDPDGCRSSGSVGKIKRGITRAEHTWIVPTSAAVTTDRGFTVKFVAGRIKETSAERSVEVYSTSEVGWETGLGLTSGPVTFKVTASEKKGVKWTDRRATKDTQRDMIVAEKSFEIIGLSRHVIEIEWETLRQPNIVPWNISWSSSEWTLKSVKTKSKEVGYEVAVSPGRSTVGYFWPDYARHDVTETELRKSALQKVAKELQNQIKVFAHDLLLM